MIPGEHRLRWKIDGVPRRCLVHVPARYSERVPVPVVLLFHGAGASARWMLLETGLTALADQETFLVVLPEGLPPNPKAVSSFLTNPLSWNDGSPYWSQHDDIGFLRVLLDELPQRVNVDLRRIYAAGFSNGAGFTFRLAQALSSRLAAAAPIAGLCWAEKPTLARPVPTLYMIGTADPLVPLDGGAVATPWGFTMTKPPVALTWQRWAGALGCPQEPQSIHEIAGGQQLIFGPGRESVEMTCHTLTGHGHHWPGGRGELSEEIGGPNVRGVNANTLLWEFFQRHALSGDW